MQTTAALIQRCCTHHETRVPERSRTCLLLCLLPSSADARELAKQIRRLLPYSLTVTSELASPQRRARRCESRRSVLDASFPALPRTRTYPERSTNPVVHSELPRKSLSSSTFGSAA